MVMEIDDNFSFPIKKGDGGEKKERVEKSHFCMCIACFTPF
jgi:hypothetical protein